MADVKTGRPQADPTASAHTPGIYSGNSRGNYEKQVGHEPDGRRTARSATGVNPGAAEPIDPRMPNLPPA
jgi:hypothetical protein